MVSGREMVGVGKMVREIRSCRLVHLAKENEGFQSFVFLGNLPS